MTWRRTPIFQRPSLAPSLRTGVYPQASKRCGSMRRFLRSDSQFETSSEALARSIGKVTAFGLFRRSRRSASSASSGERFELTISQKAAVLGGGDFGLKLLMSSCARQAATSRSPPLLYQPHSSSQYDCLKLSLARADQAT